MSSLSEYILQSRVPVWKATGEIQQYLRHPDSAVQRAGILAAGEYFSKQLSAMVTLPDDLGEIPRVVCNSFLVGANRGVRVMQVISQNGQSVTDVARTMDEILGQTHRTYELLCGRIMMDSILNKG